MIKHCNKHDLNYEAKETMILGRRFLTECHKCQAEANARAKAQANAEALAHAKQMQALQDEINKLAIQASRIPKRYLKPADLNAPNFKEYVHILATEIKGHILIVGGVGVGKTYYASELIKRNAELKPIYLCGNELSYMQKSDFSLKKIAESIAEHDLIVVDEIGYLLESAFMLDMIIDLCYRDDKALILAGNITFKDLQSKLEEHTLSRFKQGLQILTFKGNDLRGAK